MLSSPLRDQASQSFTPRNRTVCCQTPACSPHCFEQIAGVLSCSQDAFDVLLFRVEGKT